MIKYQKRLMKIKALENQMTTVKVLDFQIRVQLKIFTLSGNLLYRQIQRVEIINNHNLALTIQLLFQRVMGHLFSQMHPF